MDYLYNETKSPSVEELKILFTQTTWASKRENMGIERMLENSDVIVTVRAQGRLIGFGRALSDGVYRALLDDIVVDDSFRKQGIGKEIVKRLLEKLDCVEEIYLNTGGHLFEFYSSLGFVAFSGLTMRRNVGPGTSRQRLSGRVVEKAHHD